jgi:hypothetical protein
MARNRKYQSAAVRFGPVLKAFLLCALICGAAVGYVWQKSQILELGKQIKSREQTLTRLQDQNRKLRDQLAVLRSSQTLDQRQRALNLGLGLPQPAQVWHLPEPTRAAPAQTAGNAAPQLAAQTSRAPLTP